LHFVFILTTLTYTASKLASYYDIILMYTYHHHHATMTIFGDKRGILYEVHANKLRTAGSDILKTLQLFGHTTIGSGRSHRCFFGIGAENEVSK